MRRIKPEVDILKDLLDAALQAYPGSAFLQGLAHQYRDRGGLSKKQLQGLYGKAVKIKTIPPAKLATLEAIILKKPNRYRSGLPAATPLFQKDMHTGKMIGEILALYPHHKRLVFLRLKFERNEVLTAQELAEVKRFYQLLVSPSGSDAPGK